MKGRLSESQGKATDLRNDQSISRPMQSIRTDGFPGQDRRTDRERDQGREREATRSAEFQKLIAPRSGGPTFGAIPDPINAPDATRRALVPVVPSGSDSGLGRSVFAPPAANLPRMQDNNMLGVASPAASSLTPSIGAPLNAQSPAPRSSSIILEPPKRRWN